MTSHTTAPSIVAYINSSGKKKRRPIGPPLESKKTGNIPRFYALAAARRGVALGVVGLVGAVPLTSAAGGAGGGTTASA